MNEDLRKVYKEMINEEQLEEAALKSSSLTNSIEVPLIGARVMPLIRLSKNKAVLNLVTSDVKGMTLVQPADIDSTDFDEIVEKQKKLVSAIQPLIDKFEKDLMKKIELAGWKKK